VDQLALGHHRRDPPDDEQRRADWKARVMADAAMLIADALDRVARAEMAKIGDTSA
jgi:hypothetical protein